ncbi:rhodanese-like domain-containing protein [Kaarinaea lacus]
MLDVRTAKDFVNEQGHIAQARNFPVEQLAEHTDELSELRRRPIAIICRTDKRSMKAA